ncbi:MULTISPECIES: tetratricopeptide repeat protein [Paraburkholderia]|uniref:Tetratricopeptide repeat protein n=1 Tax=Paraburkholderia madseniana TaxID=2599607 RepID=A0AAP5F274_9BURK|nr:MULTISPECIES: tetratricopeptide repeat protein [Paraburkholderia]MCX4152255.1 tetratricopeptide repeat protein [Paraburkholderia madseniana]MDN7155184.1 tetratricopeptide repeat-containing protein [Paraburkholderia sp. WS6]MDQ6414067.1 tetratricopeptide repeat-containing protein [Paraburkholderia madseniana]
MRARTNQPDRRLPRSGSRYGLRPSQLPLRNASSYEGGQPLRKPIHLSTTGPSSGRSPPRLKARSARWLKIHSARTARALRELGKILRRLQKFDEASRELRRCLTIRENKLGWTHADVADVLLEMGWVAYHQENDEEALMRFGQVYELAQHLEPRARLTAAAMQGQATLLRRQYKLSEAEALLRNVLALRQASLSSAHPLVATTLQSLAHVCVDQGKFEEAERLFRSALEIREHTAGPAHPETIAVLRGLAWALRRSRKFEQAAAYLQQALAITEASHFFDSLRIAEILLELGWLAFDLGRLDDAHVNFQRALNIAEERDAEKMKAASLQGMASVVSRQGRPQEAEALFRNVLALRQALYGENHPSVATAMMGLAYPLIDQRRFSEAEELFRSAVKIREKTVGPTHPDTAVALKGLGSVLRRLQRFDEADEVLDRVSRINKRTIER